MTFASLPPVLEERTLLLELNHRINNELASVINLVSVAAVRADNSEVKAALSDIVELLHEHAEVHRALKMPSRDTLIDAADHLAKLCFAMSSIPIGSHEHTSPICGGSAEVAIGAVLARRAGRLRVGDQFGATCIF